MGGAKWEKFLCFPVYLKAKAFLILQKKIDFSCKNVASCYFWNVVGRMAQFPREEKKNLLPLDSVEIDNKL